MEYMHALRAGSVLLDWMSRLNLDMSVDDALQVENEAENLSRLSLGCSTVALLELLELWTRQYFLLGGRDLAPRRWGREEY